MLLDNAAPSIVVLPGALLEYSLPAPNGRWINAPGGSTQLLTDGVTSDYPFACSPGVSGSSSDVVAQNGPQCTGLCPEGFMCPGATGTPATCSEGGFCPRSSAAAAPCPDVN